MPPLQLGKKVNSLYHACLLKTYYPAVKKTTELTEITIPDNAILVSGKFLNAIFDPHCIKKYQGNIREILALMNERFMKGENKGGSFRDFCVDKNEKEWGDYTACDQLLCLGIATNMIVLCSNPDKKSIPAWTPFFYIDLEARLDD